MICNSVKEGANCIFMKKKGCSFNGGKCYPIVDSCDGCDMAEEYPTGIYCKSCAEPASKWSTSTCNLATHVKKENGITKNKLNPLKASKRSMHA